MNEFEKVWVAFSDECLKKIFLQNKNNKIKVVCDSAASNYKSLNIIDVRKINVNNYIKCDELKKQFYTITRDFDHEILGFVNNFYTCSLVLLMQYMIGIRDLHEKNPNIKIIFLKKPIPSTAGPNFYLAEYETHAKGKFLYSRCSAFTRIISKYCKSLGIEVTFQGGFLSSQKILNIIRLLGVWLIRFYKDLLFSYKHKNLDIPESVVDLLAVSRSYSQSHFFLNLLKRNRFLPGIVFGNSFAEKDNYIKSQSIERNAKIARYRLLGGARLTVFRYYFMYGFYALTSSKKFIQLLDVKIDITQAIREILVMLPEVILYRQRLEKTVKKICINKKVLLTSEMKSPHAYAEAIVAKKNGLKCVQIMSVFIDSLSLPNPISGDLFVVDSQKRYEVLSKSWEGYCKKLYYAGRVYEKKRLDKNETREFLLCYFAPYYLTDVNIKAQKYLNDYSIKNNIKFIIKLHPRDESDWYKPLMTNNCYIVQHGSISQEKLFSLFEVALVGPSAVVLQLFLHNKKFLYYNPIESRYGFVNPNDKFDGVPCVDDKYKPVIHSLSCIEEWLDNITLLEQEREQLFCRMCEHGEKIVTREEFLNKIINKVLR